MHCMHQKTDYACYARTQLRNWLHTMHTETRIGVSVGLRGWKCMHLRMHTDCIQSAYKWMRTHKRRKREDSSFYFFFILSVLLSSTARDFRHSSFTVRVFRHVRIPSGHSDYPSGLIACSFRSGSAVIHDKPLGSWLVCIVCIKKPTMHAMWEHNSGIDCIQCIQKRE